MEEENPRAAALRGPCSFAGLRTALESGFELQPSVKTYISLYATYHVQKSVVSGGKSLKLFEQVVAAFILADVKCITVRNRPPLRGVKDLRFGSPYRRDSKVNRLRILLQGNCCSGFTSDRRLHTHRGRCTYLSREILNTRQNNYNNVPLGIFVDYSAKLRGHRVCVE